MLRIRHEGKEYDWTRFPSGEGRWLHEDTVVSLVLDHELTRAARSMGLKEYYDFARMPAKRKAEKIVKTSSAKSKAKSQTSVKIKIKVRV